MTQAIITSTSNLRIRHLRGLRKRRTRDETGETIIDGSLPLRRALDAGFPVRELFFSSRAAGDHPIIDRCRQQGIGCTQVSPTVYEKIAYGHDLDGILALADQRRHTLTDWQDDRFSLLLVAVAVEKPGNVGAMIRSAEAAGADGLLIADEGTDLYNPNVIRASRGSLFSLPVAVGDSTAANDWLRQRGVAIVAALPEADTLIWDVDLTGDCALVVGSEHAGLGPAWQQAATRQVRLPMRGGVDSLNASVSAALLLYEALRQRRQP